MSKIVKTTVITGAILIGIGIIIVIVAGFVSGWNFDTVKWDAKTFESEPGVEISNIDLEFDAGSLKVEFYDGDTIKVEYSESDQITTEFHVTNNTLKITTIVHWHVQVLWFNKIPTTRLYIPQNMQVGLKMNVNAGKINIEEGTFGDIDITINAGSIYMDKVRCNNFDVEMNAGSLRITQIVSNTFNADLSAGSLSVTTLQCDYIGVDLSAGSVKLGIAGKQSDYTIKTDVSAGSCNVKSQSGGSKRLTVDVSAGSVKILFDE